MNEDELRNFIITVMRESGCPAVRGGAHVAALPAQEEWPKSKMCTIHNEPMYLREKGGQRWYSHKTEAGWCKGAEIKQA